jgi:hypothetical protein
MANRNRPTTISIDERCRGNWGAPKSDASNATIGINECVYLRVQRLKLLTVNVRAGTAIRRYKVVKADGPEDLVVQSVSKGAPMRDNNILSRHIKPAARKTISPDAILVFGAKGEVVYESFLAPIHARNLV